MADHVDEARPSNSNSALYNAMVAPLQGLAIRGMVWYQGERWVPVSYILYSVPSSTSWHPENYRCLLGALVRQYREDWSSRAGADPQFPVLVPTVAHCTILCTVQVGVVQLGPWSNPPIPPTPDPGSPSSHNNRDSGSLFPLLRWHQTGDYGYLPNAAQPNMFLGLALDTFQPDPDTEGAGKVHPR